MDPWKTTQRQIVFRPDDGRYLSVERHEIELPDGRVIDDWYWIDTPDFVNVLVETSDNDYLVFRQTKYAVEGVTMAVVGGYIEEGEDPKVAAVREVEEETGWRLAELVELGSYAIDGNRGAGRGHLFLARGAAPLDPADQPESDDLEEQELLKINRSELHRALMAGEFAVASWSATVALALLL